MLAKTIQEGETWRFWLAIRWIKELNLTHVIF